MADINSMDEFVIFQSKHLLVHQHMHLLISTIHVTRKMRLLDVMGMISKANVCAWRKPNRDADLTMVVDGEAVLIDGMVVDTAIVMDFEVEDVDHHDEENIAFSFRV